jgi:hypothetical protein
MVRYLTTNGESAVYNPTPPFTLRYRRARREFCKGLTWKVNKISRFGGDDMEFGKRSTGW